MKLRYKILIGIAAFILLIPLWVYLWFQTRPAWIEPPTETVTLELKRGMLTDADLGADSEFEVIRQLRVVTSLDLDKHPRETDFEFDEAAKHWGHSLWTGDKYQQQVLAWAKDSFAIVKTVSTKTKQGIPTATSMDPEDAGDYFSLVKHVGEANLLLADKLFTEGKVNEAFRINRNVRQFGCSISRGGALINHLVAVSATVSATRQLRNWVSLAGDKVPVEMAIQTANDLISESQNRESELEAMRAEHIVMQGMLKKMFNGEFFDDPSRLEISSASKYWRITGSSPEVTYKNFEQVFSAMLLCLPIDAKQEHIDAWNRFEERMFDRSNIIKHKNPLGLLLATMILPATNIGISKIREGDLHIQATATILAMHAYKAKHGNTPKALGDLVPDYMSTLPTDIFTLGKPLQYKRGDDGNWTLYSVGKDRKDNGGKREPNSRYNNRVHIGTTREKGYDAVFVSNEFDLLKEAAMSSE